MKLFSLVAPTSCFTFASCMYYAPIKIGYGAAAGMMQGGSGYGDMLGFGLGGLFQFIMFLVVFKVIISQLGPSHDGIGGSHGKSYYKGRKEQLSSATQAPEPTPTPSPTPTPAPTPFPTPLP